MIEGLRPYPKYRPYELAWARRIPSHWGLPRLGSILYERRETNEAGEISQVLSVLKDTGVVPYEQKGNIGNKKSDDTRRYKIVRPDDIVMNSMNVIIGSVGRSRFTGCLSPVYYVLKRRFLEDDPRYIEAIFKVKPFQQSLVRIGNGILAHRMRIPMELLKCELVPKPPQDEQNAIVRFLDHANRRIERFIRTKKKLIALLNEQKQTIIHRAVTLGLNRDVRMKDSGLPWLPRIPASWRVSRLKFEATHIVDCLHATPQYVVDGQFPAIRTADIEPGRVRLSQARRVSKEEFARWTARLEPMEGDILYSREGERFGIAAPVPRGVRLCISQRMMVFRIRNTEDPEYLMWQLNCPHVYAQASILTIGSTAPHVNVEQIRNFSLVLPPNHEQRQIALHVRSKCQELEAAVEKTEREIGFIREYRTRLIADVVTGQVDVREAVKSLPPDEPSAEGTDDMSEDLDDGEEIDEDEEI